MGVSGNDNAACLREAFEARRDIHAVAKYIAVLDDNVSDVDPDAKIQDACPAG